MNAADNRELLLQKFGSSRCDLMLRVKGETNQTTGAWVATEVTATMFDVRGKWKERTRTVLSFTIAAIADCHFSVFDYAAPDLWLGRASFSLLAPESARVEKYLAQYAVIRVHDYRKKYPQPTTVTQHENL